MFLVFAVCFRFKLVLQATVEPRIFYHANVSYPLWKWTNVPIQYWINWELYLIENLNFIFKKVIALFNMLMLSFTFLDIMIIFIYFLIYWQKFHIRKASGHLIHTHPSSPPNWLLFTVSCPLWTFKLWMVSLGLGFL